MIIPPNIIFPWISTVASIPANWSRETALDINFIKGCGVKNPADTGGATEHGHNGIAHAHNETDTHGHDVAYNSSSQCDSYGGSTNSDPIAQCGHNHASSTITTRSGGGANNTIPYPSQANNNHPPYVKVIFLKAGVGAVLEDGFITLWNSATIPSGYLMCSDGVNGAPAIGNKYLKGADTGGNGGATGGSLTHQHVLDHSHTTTHSHTGTSGNDDNHPNRNNEGGGGGNKTNAHTHSVTLNSATVSTDTYTATLTSGTVEPLYKKLIALYKDGGAITKGIIGIYIGTVASIPKNWLLCNGQMHSDGITQTPDLTDYFVKIANDVAELGATGGSNTHDHPASNSHSHSQTGAHTHSGSTGSAGGSTKSGPGGTSPGAHTHTLASVGNNNATLAWDASQMSAESVNNEPNHVIVAFVQLEKVDEGTPHILEG